MALCLHDIYTRYAFNDVPDRDVEIYHLQKGKTITGGEAHVSTLYIAFVLGYLLILIPSLLSSPLLLDLTGS
jgi:hypothetical protein